MPSQCAALSHVADPVPDDGTLPSALACLDRFTDRFNACDALGMDAELHFPHTMLSGPSRIDWPARGALHPDFFTALRATGWHRTRYEDRQVVLIASDKVHFVVTYSRRDVRDAVLSTHVNPWIVTRVDGRWGIALRSY